jgi:hypothetical protein
MVKDKCYQVIRRLNSKPVLSKEKAKKILSAKGGNKEIKSL